MRWRLRRWHALSFATAADALHVTPAAVRMQIRTLEEYLAVPLFCRPRPGNRTNGERRPLLLPGCAGDSPSCGRRCSSCAGSAQRRAQHQHGGLACRSGCSAPPQFYDRCPQIELSIHTSPLPVDFAHGDFHAALRMSTVPTPGLYNEKLLDEWFLPVCTAQLRARHGSVETAADLRRYPLLRSADESWSMWRHPGADTDWRERGAAFDDLRSPSVAAAEQGQGLALTAGRSPLRTSPTAVPCA
jgi:LysR family glycine cleavage system transcriptional activator